MHKLIKPVSGTDKETPVLVMWTSNKDDMAPLHWVLNHFVPLLKLPEWYKIDDENNNDLGVSDNYQTKQSRMERPIEVESSAHDISDTENATKVYVCDLTAEMGTANVIRTADGTECTFKEFMESSVDSLNIGMGKVDGANNGTESDSKDTGSKVNGSNGGTDSDSKDVDAIEDGSNGGTDSDKTDDDPKIDGAKVGTDSDSKDVEGKVDGSNGSDSTNDDPKIDGAIGGTASDKTDDDAKVDGSNGSTDSNKTDGDPKIDGAKVGTDSDSKYSKDAAANDDREQHETEHVNTDLNDHEGVRMGEKHGDKISDSDIDTNFDTCANHRVFLFACNQDTSTDL
ncbi:clumping factor A-like [Mya arenaria]|uniref:clumping factor A-like n=1 Tax=Mya arenaria TaxID=6604 RepID=UPI0022E4F2B1|nr:clumping factor A-like [Mya arenaria]